jgi:hypothetical protein
MLKPSEKYSRHLACSAEWQLEMRERLCGQGLSSGFRLSPLAEIGTQGDAYDTLWLGDVCDTETAAQGTWWNWTLTWL